MNTKSKRWRTECEEWMRYVDLDNDYIAFACIINVTMTDTIFSFSFFFERNGVTKGNYGREAHDDLNFI